MAKTLYGFLPKESNVSTAVLKKKAHGWCTLLLWAQRREWVNVYDVLLYNIHHHERVLTFTIYQMCNGPCNNT